MTSQEPDPDVEVLPLSGPRVQVLLAQTPSVPGQLLTALWRARGRQQGALRDQDRQRLGPIAVVQRGLRLEAGRVARFRAVCADRGSQGLAPAAYLETLFIGPMTCIALHPDFPFSPLGLVHLVQRIEQRRWVRLDERLDLSCELAALRRSARGYQVDCAMALHSDGELVWQGLATLLSRSPAARGRAAAAVTRDPAADARPEPRAVVDAAADVGRRYAAASGDYNPHHLHLLSARLVGFRRPIAHGMWTLARSLAELGATACDAERLQVEVRFKRPLFLPGRFAVIADDTAPRDPQGRSFEVRHPESGEPYLAGQLRW